MSATLQREPSRTCGGLSNSATLTYWYADHVSENTCAGCFPLDENERCDPLIIRGRYFVMMTVLDRRYDFLVPT